ncbi:MAG: cytochrome c peroxidase [Gemmatimonadota bacterium]
MTMRNFSVATRALPLLTLALVGCDDVEPSRVVAPVAGALATASSDLDAALRQELSRHGFTGRIAGTLEARLGRPLDHRLANVGRLLWFDPIQGLNDDNACGGCHAPTNGFGDTQPIAIGIDNNRIVGADRQGPRNQRRSPMVINSAFYPTLMWNSRFQAVSGNPFDNRQGFAFPVPEGGTLSYLPHLLTAQAFIPPTERTEAAGFHFPGGNDEMRAAVVRRLNADANYRQLFARARPQQPPDAPITFDDVARAISEFEFTLTFANAPIDQYARGRDDAMSPSEKRGAMLFFGKARCVACHAVSGASNEMFSDFRQHVAGTPQVMPALTNVTFDGPATNEDFGLEQVSANLADRYAFRTSPLRNVALQPAFMHNGAFTALEPAMRYHLDATAGAANYTPAHLPPDLRGPIGPLQPVVERLDPLLRVPVPLSEPEFAWLLDFVRDALLDPDARPTLLRRLIPDRLPSGRAPLLFR